MNLISKERRYGPIARGSHSLACHPHELYLSLLREHSPDGDTHAPSFQVQNQSRDPEMFIYNAAGMIE